MRQAELPQMRRARLARERRRRRRSASRMHQLTLPAVLRGIDLEPLLRGELLAQMAAVLLKRSELDLATGEPAR